MKYRETLFEGDSPVKVWWDPPCRMVLWNGTEKTEELGRLRN